MIPVNLLQAVESEFMIQTDPGSKFMISSDLGIRFRDPRKCLVKKTAAVIEESVRSGGRLMLRRTPYFKDNA